MIAASPGYNSSVTIDAGRDDGIKPDETVLNGAGPGRHGHLGGRAHIDRAAHHGRVVHGRSAAGRHRADRRRSPAPGRSRPGPALLRLQVFDAGAVLQPGQQLVTFGSVHGRPYVPGVPVGVITQVQASATSLTKVALVRPYADDSALGVVGVVIVPPRTNPRDSVLPPRPATPSRQPGRRAFQRVSQPGGHAQVPGAEVRRVTFALVAILAAVVLQTALLDRLPFPGGSAPNLVLVLVVTLALASGPTEGMLIGFGAGLALDIAPPASNLLGLSALVFCVIGYGCGRLRGPLERSAWLPLAVVALGVAAGEALYALAGHDLRRPGHHLAVGAAGAARLGGLRHPALPVRAVRRGPVRRVRRLGDGRRRQPESLAGREPAGAGLLGGVAAAGLAGRRGRRPGHQERA